MNISNLLKIMQKPSRLPLKIYYRYPQIFKWMNDELCLKVTYRMMMGKKLDLENPVTFNEKLQWLKLHDRRTEYTTMVDKYEAKKYVSNRIGEEFIIPTLGIWNCFDDICLDKLPNEFVLKCTHDSGGLVICQNKNELDIKAAQKRINRSLKKNFYWVGREWPYKNVEPRIIAEKFMPLSGDNCAEYKLFCYNGSVVWCMICTGDARLGTRTNDGFTSDFEHLPIKFGYKNSERIFKKPEEWLQLIDIAEKLSEGIPQVRVDTYLINGKIYFGELTFYHESGFGLIDPAEWDFKLGEKLDLPEVIE